MSAVDKLCWVTSHIDMLLKNNLSLTYEHYILKIVVDAVSKQLQ